MVLVDINTEDDEQYQSRQKMTRAKPRKMPKNKMRDRYKRFQNQQKGKSR